MGKISILNQEYPPELQRALEEHFQKPEVISQMAIFDRRVEAAQLTPIQKATGLIRRAVTSVTHILR